MNSLKKRNQKSKKPNVNGQSVLYNTVRSYTGQATWKFKVPGLATKLTSTVTTGVISNSYGISIANVLGFATRFGATFDEYRILRSEVQIRPISSLTGVTVFFFDEKSATAPTANESTERVGMRVPNSNASDSSVLSMIWTARDLLDLEYTAIGTTVTPVYFKTYTDNNGWGTTTVASDLWIVEPLITFEFRGLKSS